MVQKCKRCGEKIVKFPLKDEQGKIIWKNLFKMDAQTFFMVLAIILILLGTKQMIEECKVIVEEPVKFCKDNGYCDLILQMENQDKQYAEMMEGIEDFDISTQD